MTDHARTTETTRMTMKALAIRCKNDLCSKPFVEVHFVTLLDLIADASALASARAEVVEACCKAVCHMCSDGQGLVANEHGRLHHIVTNNGYPSYKLPCLAAAIRSAFPGAGKEETP